MLQRHDTKIRSLNSRPNHPILLQRIRIRGPQLLLGTAAFHDGHGREEAQQVRGRKDCLVDADFRGDLEAWAGGEFYAPLEEGEPDCRGGAEDSCRVG